MRVCQRRGLTILPTTVEGPTFVLPPKVAPVMPVQLRGVADIIHPDEEAFWLYEGDIQTTDGQGQVRIQRIMVNRGDRLSMNTRVMGPSVGFRGADPVIIQLAAFNGDKAESQHTVAYAREMADQVRDIPIDKQDLPGINERATKGKAI